MNTLSLRPSTVQLNFVMAITSRYLAFRVLWCWRNLRRNYWANTPAPEEASFRLRPIRSGGRSADTHSRWYHSNFGRLKLTSLKMLMYRCAWYAAFSWNVDSFYTSTDRWCVKYLSQFLLHLELRSNCLPPETAGVPSVMSSWMHLYALHCDCLWTNTIKHSEKLWMW